MPDADINQLPEDLVALAASLEDAVGQLLSDWWRERERVFGLVGPDTEIEDLELSLFEEEILSFARMRWPLSHAERLVHAVFSWDSDWQSDMIGSMGPVLVNGRLSGVRYALSRLGYRLPQGFRLRGELVGHTTDHVMAVAQKMRETQHSWLGRAIDRVKAWWREDYGSLRGLNRNNLSSRLARLEERRSAWHVPLTGLTEAAWSFNQGIRDFIDLNDPSAEAMVLPPDASDPERDHPPPCVEFAGGWFPYGSLPEFPIHPDCVHYLGRFRFSRDTLVSPVLDLGGEERYFVSTLERV